MGESCIAQYSIPLPAVRANTGTKVSSAEGPKRCADGTRASPVWAPPRCHPGRWWTVPANHSPRYSTRTLPCREPCPSRGGGYSSISRSTPELIMVLVQYAVRRSELINSVRSGNTLTDGVWILSRSSSPWATSTTTEYCYRARYGIYTLAIRNEHCTYIRSSYISVS